MDSPRIEDDALLWPQWKYSCSAETEKHLRFKRDMFFGFDMNVSTRVNREDFIG